MTDLERLADATGRNPNDLILRQVYADALQEQGTEAAFVRHPGKLIIYRGWLKLGSNGEEKGILEDLTSSAGTDHYDFLADRLEMDLEDHGHFLSVRYYLANVGHLNEQEMREYYILWLMGMGEAKYQMNYSEVTGYLWTTEEFVVGGHDLLEELKTHRGKFCQLEIEYHREKPC